MRILHYSLGFPPYRSGGLTKFCMDLMKQQISDGHYVALMWPGQMGFVIKKTSIKDRGLVDNIRSFEVINPLPISYDEGINKIDEFIKDVPVLLFEKLLISFRPDVIHIHTLMGLHKEFLLAANKLKIRIVFTSHDYFPICPKVTMFCNGNICTNAGSCSNCPACNSESLSMLTIKILQSPLYRMMKDSAIVKRLRKKHRDNYLTGKSIEKSTDKSASAKSDNASSVVKASDYIKLREHYKDMLSLVNVIHYNSALTKSIYEEYIGKFPSEIISISHSDIKDNRREKKYGSEVLRVRYLGPYSESKGFNDLVEAVSKARPSFYKKIEVDVHFHIQDKPDFINFNDRYEYSQLGEIFDNTDVVIVPSKWNETFGYTVLEALSFGVPVIMSSHVGARDILNKDAGIVYEDVNELTDILGDITPDKLTAMNKAICEEQEITTIGSMAERICEKCYK